MLTITRSNRAEFLVDLLAQELRQCPPPPLQQLQVVVNTWPTSRWLQEQLALRLGGVVANLRCPFPAAHLAAIVDQCLEDNDRGAMDPWRASRLVWPLLELLPSIAALEAGQPLARWLQQRLPGPALDLASWQLGRAIADSFDDYALYRPELLIAWEAGQDIDGRGEPLPPQQIWQPLLYRSLRRKLGREPAGLRVERAIEQLGKGPLPLRLAKELNGTLRLFGLSSLAPLQVRLLQALAAHLQVDLYLLTPCPDLWQRCVQRREELRDALALRQPLQGEWLRQAPPLEARFGRLGAEFQQLLEGTGEAQLAPQREEDLFFAAAGIAAQRDQRTAPLLDQLQEQLVAPALFPKLERRPDDDSLEFHPCPGPLRQVQIVRDRVLQLLAANSQLEPRDILVMTPSVEEVAPLVAAVFGDHDATGVYLPWRLTDRSQQAQAGLARTLLILLRLAGERLTASGLEQLLSCRPLQQRFELEEQELGRMQRELQRLGFRWGLDARQRGDDGSHSLRWAIDRLLLSLVIPATPGRVVGGVAAAEARLPLDLVGRWLHLLRRLAHWLELLGRSHTAARWQELLRQLLADLFGDGGSAAAELPGVLSAVEDSLGFAGGSDGELEVAVVVAVLEEALAVDSGRFGHRSGALTISALEPMRAIPHQVIVLMGLDAASFPRQSQRPGFDLIGQARMLGDADPADQDRYILLEALLSARSHLLITWNCRDERTGEALPPSAPVRHWLDWLSQELGDDAAGLLIQHPASPLERANFLPCGDRAPASCDRRLLAARKALDLGQLQAPQGLAFASAPPAMACPSVQEPGGTLSEATTLRDWLIQPQRWWLERLGMRPREWQEESGDLEALELDERQRSALLRPRIEEARGSLDALPTEAQDWLLQQRGTGRLPAAAGGLLEARALAQRSASLKEALIELGEPWQREGIWQGGSIPLTGRGDTLLLVHGGRASIGHQLSLWLDLLIASAGDPPAPASRAALISRDGSDVLRVSHTLMAPTAEQARLLLQQLLELHGRWLERCWPVPPLTGWAWFEAECKRPGSGAQAARLAWEGSPLVSGESQREEMLICFGDQLDAAELLQDPFNACASELFAPLHAAIQPSRPRREAA